MKELESLARILSGKYGVEVVFRGSQAYTDGNKIVLPALPENMDKAAERDLRALLHSYDDHEVGHVIYTYPGEEVKKSFKAKLEGILGENGARYIKRVKKVANYLEDIRIENLMGQAYPGCRDNLERLANHILNDPNTDVDNIMMKVFAEGRRHVCGHKIERPDCSAEVLKTFGADFFNKIRNASGILEITDLAEKCLKHLEEDPEGEEPRGDDEEDGDKGEPKGGKSDKAKDGKEKTESDKSDEEPESDESGDGEGSDGSDEASEGDDDEGSAGDGDEGNDGEGSDDQDGDADKAGEEGDGKGSDADGSDEGAGEGDQEGSEDGDGSGETVDSDDRTKGRFAEEGSDGSDGKASMDEIDEAPEDAMDRVREGLEKLHETSIEESRDYMVYDKSFDVLKVMDEAPDTTIFDSLKASLGKLNIVKAKLQNLFLARTTSRWIGDREEGKINNKALAKVATGCNRVYRERWTSKDRDTCVTFLCDFSGSMSGKRMENAMRAVVLFLEALEGTKVKSEVLTYTTGLEVLSGTYIDDEDKAREYRDKVYADDNIYSYGRIESLWTEIIKSFDEPYGAKVKRRISGYKGAMSRNNCDGESVQLAYDRIKGRREARKILFVLTDGIVCSAGNDASGRRYLKKVCDAIAKGGKVELIGLGLGCDEGKRFYPQYVYLDHKADLATVLLAELRKILKV